jgi:anti-sigma B factor antagonist
MNYMNEASNSVLWELPVARAGVSPRSLRLSLEIRLADDVTIVVCRGRIVYRDEAAVLSDRVARLMPEFRKLVLDLSDVEMVDSAGLGEFVVLHKRALASGSSIKLAAPRRHVHRVLELTQLASVFEVHSTVDQAIGSFQEQFA